MKNLDALAQQKAQIMQRFTEAVKSGDDAAFQQVFADWTEMVEQSVLAEAKGLIQSADNQILASRGVRALTSEESMFYQKFIDAAKLPNPKQALTGTDYILPQTVIDTIFEDIQAEHPLLGFIDFMNVGGITKMIVATTSGVAAWGELGDEITSELSAAFSESDMTHKKLSAFMPLSNAMLDMGPAWIDRFVRAVLTEALATELEAAIVDADGEDGPLGMTRALTGAVDGVYPRKTAVVVTALDPLTIGGILNTISQGPNGKRRGVPRLLMVVNPSDYFTKVFPATTVRNTDGSFTSNVLPYPMDVVISPAVPSGKAVFGLAKRYHFGLGSGAGKGGKLEYSDEYKFLEDYRVYRIKLYGNGKALDANAFVYADISGLTPYVQRVYVTNGNLAIVPEDGALFDARMVGDARLASLAIGAKTLSPTFNKSTHSYTCATTDATNTISAVAMNGEAIIEIKNGETTVANGAAATWATGANTLTVTVTLGELTETYTVIVTKS